jgi:hypothetical protein
MWKGALLQGPDDLKSQASDRRGVSYASARTLGIAVVPGAILYETAWHGVAWLRSAQPSYTRKRGQRREQHHGALSHSVCQPCHSTRPPLQTIQRSLSHPGRKPPALQDCSRITRTGARPDHAACSSSSRAVRGRDCSRPARPTRRRRGRDEQPTILRRLTAFTC